MWRRIKTEVGRLEGRYGRRPARLILAAMVVLAAVPVPGVSLLPLGVAELVKGTFR